LLLNGVCALNTHSRRVSSVAVSHQEISAMPFRPFVAAAIVGAATLASGAAHAGGHVNFSVGVNVPMYAAPVYVQPQPVYVQPQTVYVPNVYAQPQVVYTQPQVVYPPAVTYYSQPAVVIGAGYYVGGGHHHHHHGGHRR
jgi:hypothetical protein